MNMRITNLPRIFNQWFGQGRPVDAPTPEAVARSIGRIVEQSPATPDLSQFHLDAEAVSALLAHASRVRAALALNLLHLRAMNDIAVFPALKAFAGDAFQHPDGDMDFNRLLTRVESSLQSGKVGTIASRHPRFAQVLDDMIGAPALFDTLTLFMDRAFGFVEVATRENYNEQSYLMANPDVAAAFSRGEIASGRAHFLAHGEKEGRTQRNLGPKPGEAERELIYPIAFRRHETSSAGVGAVAAGPRVERDALLAAPLDGPFAISLVTAREEHDASASFLTEKAIGKGSAKSDALRDNLTWVAPPIYLAAFGDACADVENGVVTFDRDRAWGDSCFTTILSAGGRRRAPDMFPLAGRYARVRRASDEETLRADVPLMLCCSWASRCNYGHWLMNSLLSVYLVIDELKSGRLKLLCPVLTDRQRNEILAMGTPAEAIVESGARYVRCGRLIYPSPLATLANMSPSAISVEFLHFLEERLGTPKQGPAPEYIFLSRMGFPSGRRMSNERELAAALEKIGFVTALTHEMTLAEQIRFMSNAKLAVGQFGAALWNIPFMPRGGRVVEIATSNYLSNEYLHIARLCRHEFARVTIDASSPENRAYEGESFAFEAPVEEIVALARSLM